MANIKLKTDLTTIKNLRESGKRLAFIVKKVGEAIKPGVSLIELDRLAYDLIVNSDKKEKGNYKPALLNYRPYGADFPYPNTLCISVNDAVVHGIPNEYKLKSGDIVSIDTCLDYKGMITDHTITFPVGKIKKEDEELLKITKGALMAGIKMAISGNHIQDISSAIEGYIKKEGKKINKDLGIIKTLAGHGVGYKVHEDPYVQNYDDGTKGAKLIPGMVLAIEPMVNLGTEDIYQDKDGYTLRTTDGKNSAHFEHTILITKDKPEILTVL
ncbi:MAG: Methionine aminopeptidase 1 [Patescibacteria group bacterium]|nr:Methionine aminopeptidase 1 [Patescibacteria group bacterium]